MYIGSMEGHKKGGERVRLCNDEKELSCVSIDDMLGRWNVWNGDMIER